MRHGRTATQLGFVRRETAFLRCLRKSVSMKKEGEWSFCLRNAPRRDPARVTRLPGFFMARPAEISLSAKTTAATLISSLIILGFGKESLYVNRPRWPTRTIRAHERSS